MLNESGASILPNPVATCNPLLDRDKLVAGLGRTLREAALKYARRGWRIIPVRPQSKKPMLNDWPNQASCDPDLVRSRFANPNANIGVAMGRGSGVWTLDVDLPDGPANLALLEAQHGQLPQTLIMRTGSGGVQYFFKYPDGREIPSKVSPQALGHNIDVRGQGGQSVVPPSIHPNGEQYVWLNDIEPAEAPAWLLDMVCFKPAPPRVEPSRGLLAASYAAPISHAAAGANPGPVKPTAWAQAAFEREIEELSQAPQGSRNDSLNDASFALGQLVAGGALDRHEVEQHLLGTARALGLADDEARATMTSGLEAGRRNPRSGPKPAAGHGVGEVDDEQSQSQQSQSQQSQSQQFNAATRALDTFGRENLIHSKGGFWSWRESGVWRQTDDLEIKQLIQRGEAGNPKLTGPFVTGALSLVQNEVFRASHQFDQDIHAINCLNGELHWTASAWELRPHQRESYRTTQIPVVYDPKTKAPRFEEFLKEVFRDDHDHEDKFALVCEAIGYSLLSNCEYEKFFLLIGPGANGKSVLMDTVTALVGSVNTAAVQPSQFENRFQRAHLHGKLVNLVTEIAEGAEIADAQLKSIVSGEVTTAEHKHAPPFEFAPICTCWFGTNHMPHTRDFSAALFRRAIILRFNRTFSEKEQDRKLKGKLRAELPGILNLALEAMAGVFQRQSFTAAPSCEAAKNEWRIEADQVAQFVEDCCFASPGHKVPSFTMYMHYQAWAEEAGIRRTLNRKNFTDRMCKLGAENGKSSGGERMFWGFSLGKDTNT